MEAAVDTSYIKTMDLLSRSEMQINQAENDIYEDLRDNHEIEDIRMHKDGQDSDCYIVADNYTLAQEKLPNDNVVVRMRDLIRARVELLNTKIDVQSNYII